MNVSQLLRKLLVGHPLLPDQIRQVSEIVGQVPKNVEPHIVSLFGYPVQSLRDQFPVFMVRVTSHQPDGDVVTQFFFTESTGIYTVRQDIDIRINGPDSLSQVGSRYGYSVYSSQNILYSLSSLFIVVPVSWMQDVICDVIDDGFAGSLGQSSRSIPPVRVYSVTMLQQEDVIEREHLSSHLMEIVGKDSCCLPACQVESLKRLPDSYLRRC